MIYFVTYRKFNPLIGTIRVEFAIPALSRQEARTIAAKEKREFKGYRYAGVD